MVHILKNKAFKGHSELYKSPGAKGPHSASAKSNLVEIELEYRMRIPPPIKFICCSVFYVHAQQLCKDTTHFFPILALFP